jgi:hypothetical protein
MPARWWALGAGQQLARPLPLPLALPLRLPQAPAWCLTLNRPRTQGLMEPHHPAPLGPRRLRREWQGVRLLWTPRF